jgi:hypothetical protein
MKAMAGRDKSRCLRVTRPLIIRNSSFGRGQFGNRGDADFGQRQIGNSAANLAANGQAGDALLDRAGDNAAFGGQRIGQNGGHFPAAPSIRISV